MGTSLEINYDSINWMSKYLKIITMEGRLAPLTCNTAQLKVHNTLTLQQDAGFPMRALVLKARREGVSTYCEGRIFYETHKKENRFGCVCSADLDSSNKVFKMATLFRKHLPEQLKRPVDYSSRKEIVYAEPHRSAMNVQTAGKDVLGRGGLTHYLHCTEFAFWKSAKEQFGGAAQEVPDDADTMIVIESTANGVGGAFYDMYMNALDDYRGSKSLNNYLPIFLPWYIFEKYQKTVPDNFEIGVPHQSGFQDDWLEVEDELVGKYGCSHKQLMWRRWAIKNRCQDDLILFKQEYPATVTEAFQSTGRPVFSNAMLDKQSKNAIKKGRMALFRSKEVFDIDRHTECWNIFRTRHNTHKYAIGIDTKEDRVSDPANPRSESDWNAAVVYDRTTNEVVAYYHGKCDLSTLGVQILEAAQYYNMAWVAPEIPKGLQVLRVLTENDYENIFNRQEHDEHYNPTESEKLGWRTTTTTRPWLVQTFHAVINEGKIKLNFQALIDEMRTFIYDANGKPIHQPGKHDDILFAAMIALQVHTRCPIGEDVYMEPEEYNKTNYRYAGFEDPEEDEEEDNWMYTE